MTTQYNRSVPDDNKLPGQYQTAPVASQGQVTPSVPGRGQPGAYQAGSHFKRRIHRFTKRFYSLVLALGLFAVFGVSPAFAQSKGGKLKEFGDSFYENVRSYGLTIAGCGLAVLGVIGFVLITFSGIKPEWRKLGGDAIKYGLIGVAGLAMLSVFLPAIMDLINGLGGDTVEVPTGGR